MKTIYKIGLSVFLLQWAMVSFAQKTISEGTLVYDIVIHTANKEPKMADAIDGGTITVYVKGGLSRSEMLSALGKETTIHETKTGTAVILKEYSSQKLMITLTKENWEAKNKAYKDIVFEPTNDTAIIAGYSCKKAIAKMPSGKFFTVYYAPGVVVPNKEFNTTFKNLPGLVMQYEYGTGTITLAKINEEPIAASKFDFPKSGYRVMTYDENLELKKKAD